MAVKEKNISYSYYALTQAWVFFLLGFVLLTWLHARDAGQILRKQTPIAVELTPGTKPDDIIAQIKKQAWVDEGTVTYLSADDALKMMSGAEMTDSLIALQNPFRPLVCFQIKETMEINASFLMQLEKEKGVKAVHMHNAYSRQVEVRVNKIKNAFFALCLVFVLMALLIGRYLAGNFVETKRKVIHMYVRLGAGDLQLKRPYLKQAAVLGLAGSCIGICLIGLILLLIFYVSPTMAGYIEVKKFIIVVIFLLIFGPLIPVIFVNYGINQAAKQ